MIWSCIVSTFIFLAQNHTWFEINGQRRERPDLHFMIFRSKIERKKLFTLRLVGQDGMHRQNCRCLFEDPETVIQICLAGSQGEGEWRQKCRDCQAQIKIDRTDQLNVMDMKDG